MKKHRIQLLLTCTAFLLMAVFLVSGKNVDLNYDYRPGEVLYQLNSADEAAKLETEYGLNLIDISDHLVATFSFAETTDIRSLLAKGFTLNANSYQFAPPWQSDTDPYLKDQYALTLTNTIQAWTLEEGSVDVTVAIIDSGIDINHDEFIGRISLLSYNTVTDAVGLDAVVDDSGHGTMVAGVIGAIKDNAKGIAGIAQNVKLLVIKANTPNEGSFQDSSIIEGIYYAVDHGADIINLSLGGPNANPLTQTAIRYALDHNVIVIAACGNDGDDGLIYPASFPEAVSVSAVTSDRLVADYSNHNDEVDIAAPGSEIVTTAMDNGYASVSGTSFAAPQISGILALLLSYDAGLSVAEMKTRLFSTAADQGAIGVDDYYGYGLVNSYSLLATEFVKITFETFAGSDIDPIWVMKNTTFAIAGTPTLADNIFLGWYKDALLTLPWNEDTDVASTDITLYAKYTSSFHTVTLVSDGSNSGQITVAHGATFTLPDSQLADFDFEGWYLDQTYLVPYSMAPVTSDITLYAKFQAIIYHDVTLHALGSVYDVITVRDGDTPTLPSLSIAGYDFVGWYLDSGLLTPYAAGAVVGDIELYAKMDQIYLDVTLVVPASDPIIIPVAYGSVPDFPEVTYSTYEFAGWYLDADHLNLYTNTPITNNLTLYARFLSSVYVVTIHIPFEGTYSVYVQTGETYDPEPIVMEGYDFAGWYLDSGYLSAYTPQILSENIDLYAKMDLIYLTVRFFGADETTVIATRTVEYGRAATPPSPPAKTATVAFDFVFVGWDQELSEIKTDLDVLPVFTYTFKPSACSLLPGLDTIFVGDTWTDGGVELGDQTLYYTVIEAIDTDTAGRYIVEYDITYADEVVYTLKRIVNVVAPESSVTITLNPGVTTIKVGDDYVDAGATTNIGTVTASGTVDIYQAGVYKVTYSVSINGWIFQKSRYVYVLSEADFTNTNLFVVWKEENNHEI